MIFGANDTYRVGEKGNLNNRSRFRFPSLWGKEGNLNNRCGICLNGTYGSNSVHAYLKIIN